METVNKVDLSNTCKIGSYKYIINMSLGNLLNPGSGNNRKIGIEAPMLLMSREQTMKSGAGWGIKKTVRTKREVKEVWFSGCTLRPEYRSPPWRVIKW